MKPSYIPKLDFGQLPKGIPGLSAPPERKANFRTSSELTSRSEFASLPQTDIITNNRPLLHTARPEFSSYSMSWETTHGKTFRPPEPNTARPTSLRKKDKWLRLDRQVLRFYLYFKESVPESPIENFRVRKCVLYYFLATDMIQITEPKVQNSGITQGSFLQKVKISNFMNKVGKDLELKDIVIGENLNIFGRVFRVVDCDENTRKYYKDTLEIELSDPEGYPEDPVTAKQKADNERAAKQASVESIGQRKKPDTLRKFLLYDDKTLNIHAAWDDSKSLYGEKRYFNITYYLCDDTIEIRELYKANSGRDKFPQFLNRSKVLKNDTHGEEEYYSLQDLILGTTIIINKRPFQLLNCDKSTLEFYKELGIEQVPVLEKKEEKVLPKMAPPPYNGFGSEADSLGSFYNLVPKAPKQNHKRTNKYDTQALRIKVELVTDVPQEMERQFVIVFFLADETIAIFEPPRRNSGILGGKFLERGRHKNEDTGKHFVIDDFRSSLENETPITVLKRKFKPIAPDKFTMDFFGMKSRRSVEEEETNRILKKIVNQALIKQVDLRQVLRRNSGGQPTVTCDSFRRIINESIEIDEENLNFTIQFFKDSRGRIAYDDFCDKLSEQYTVKTKEPSNRIDVLENLLLNKLRDDQKHIRKLFRKYDRDKNGELTFTEFQGLLEHYSLDLLPYEMAELMARYDTDKQGTIDYNEFCDKVYQCDFSSALDAKIITDTGETLDATAYLEKIRQEEEEMKQRAHTDDLVAKFCESFRQQRYMLRKTFRKIDKSGDGNISMDEFIAACDEVHPLSDDDKFQLSKRFFPDPNESLQYDTFMDVIFRLDTSSKLK